MKNAILFIILFALGATYASGSILTKSEIELKVGSNPVAILENPDTGIISIFCAGVDVNENKVIDEGEEQPSWWKYNPNGSSTEPTKVMGFDKHFVEPFKPSIDNVDGFYTIIIPLSNAKIEKKYDGIGSVTGYNMATTEVVYSETLDDSEFVYHERQPDMEFSIIRYNDSAQFSFSDRGKLLVSEKVTNETTSFDIVYGIIDFTFINDNGTRYLTVLGDNDEQNIFFVFDIKERSISKLFQESEHKHNVFVSAMSRLMSIDESLVFTSDQNLYTYKINKDKSGFDFEEHYPLPGDFFHPLSNVAKLPNGDYLLPNTNRQLNVVGKREGKHIGQFKESHRALNIAGDMAFFGDVLYVAEGDKSFPLYKDNNTVLLYDYTNQPNIDNSLKYITKVISLPSQLFLNDNQIYCFGLSNGLIADSVFRDSLYSPPPYLQQLHFDSKFGFSTNGGSTKPIHKVPNYPLNTNLSSDGIVLMPSGNSVYYFDKNENKFTDSLLIGHYASCTYRESGYNVIGFSDSSVNKSFIRIVKPLSFDEVAEVGTNVIDCILFENEAGVGAVSVSQGEDGVANAKANILRIDENGISENISLDIGSSGNSVAINSDQTSAAIVMYGSHEVHIVDLIGGTITNTISTNTSDMGGPRQVVFHNSSLYVTTYSNQVLILDLVKGEQVGTILIDGNSEGIVVKDNLLLVANSSYEDFMPCSRLLTFDIDKITNVEYTKPSEQTVRVYPNPVVDKFHIVSDDIAGTYDIVIFDEKGRVVATKSGNNTAEIVLIVKSLGLSSGTYTALINNKKTVRFVVVR